MITRFSVDLARWPSFWPQVTQFRTWSRNHQDKHFEQDSWWLLKQVTPMLPSKFGVNWPFGSEEAKNRFSTWLPWRPFWISIRHGLAIFDLQVTPMLPKKFGVNWPFGSGAEAKNRFSRWPPWRPSWISDQHDFSYFWSTSHLDASEQVWSQLAFRFRKRSEK